MSLAISVGGLNAPLDPNDSKSKLIIDSAAITAAFACASLGLRFLSRRLLHLPWLLDDWIITVATVRTAYLLNGNLTDMHSRLRLRPLSSISTERPTIIMASTFLSMEHSKA